MSPQSLLFALISHFAYTLTIKHIFFNTPHSRHTPTNPSPIKVKINDEFTFLQIERMPPLLPSEGRKAQSQSEPPHKLKHNE
jgi:hypothetical protein